MNVDELLFYIGTGLIAVGFFGGVIGNFLKNQKAKNILFYITAASLIGAMGVYVAREVMQNKPAEAPQEEVIEVISEKTPMESK